MSDPGKDPIFTHKLVLTNRLEFIRKEELL